MLTRRRLTTVSPSLQLNEPAARMGCRSPSLGEPTGPPDGHFRPVSPSLDIPELMPSPTNSPCASPSLGLIPPEAMKNATLPFKEARAGKASARMTTAVCRRASRMARPSEPSLEAQRVAAAHVFANESVMREAGMERISYDDMQRFRLNAASTGKGPAVKVDTGNPERDAVAQAKINHVRRPPFFTHCSPTDHLFLHTDGLHQEPPRRVQQPGAHLANGHAERLPADVRPAGCECYQKVRDTSRLCYVTRG